MDEVWIVIERGSLWGVFVSREAACDAYTRFGERRKWQIGWQNRGGDTWVQVGAKIGVVTVEKRKVQE